MSAALFLVMATLTVAAALVVILHKSPVYSALGLVGTLGLIAALFLGLDAHVVGFLHVIVYAGAIVVLFLFVIMLLNLQEEPEAFAPPLLVGVALVAGAGVSVAVAAGVARSAVETTPVRDGFGATIPLAERLFTNYLLPFELTSVLLLVAIIGAVVLGKRSVP